MIWCQFFKASTILVAIIRQTFQCSSTILDECLAQGSSSQITYLDVSGQSSYGFGIWFQFLSTNGILYYDQQFCSNFSGLLLLREYNSINQELRILFYYSQLLINQIYLQSIKLLINCKQRNFQFNDKKIFSNYQQNQANDTKALEKTLYFKFNYKGNLKEVTNFTFDSYKFDGRWLFAYFSYQFPYKIQIFLYDIQLDKSQGIIHVSKNDLTLTQTKIVVTGTTQIKSPIDNTVTGLCPYSGRVSKLQVNPSKENAIFATTSKFKDYLSSQLLPKAFCELQTYDQAIVDNYKYSYVLFNLNHGLRQIITQILIIQLAFLELIYFTFLTIITIKTIRSTIFFNIGLEQRKIKLNLFLDIQICFQTFYQRQPEFILDSNQFFFNETPIFQVLKQDLREWHYISMLYGVDQNQKSHQKLKMWFNDGFIYNEEYTNRTFNIDGQIIKVRSGSKYGQSVDGMNITAQSTITFCLPNPIDLIKKCHSSCQDCIGPYGYQCINCNPNSNRHLENFQCKFILGYIESNSGECILFKEFYINSIQEFNSKVQTFSQYGFFPIKTINDDTIYIRCPKYHENEQNNIFCIECLSNPELFAKQLKCVSDYILNDYGQYEQVSRNLNDIELYYYDVWKSSIILCSGCSSYCNPEIDQNCYLHSKIQLYIDNFNSNNFK